MDDLRKKKILIFLLGCQICLIGIIGYNLYTYQTPFIDLNISTTDINYSKPIIHLNNDNQLLNIEDIKYFGGKENEFFR